MSRRSALAASRSDRPSRACSTITVATTWAGTDGCPPPWRVRSGEQLGWEQLLAVVGQEGVHRPVRDQVAAPGGRVQLGIGRFDVGTHGRGSARRKPTARTTGSAQATGPTESRPFSSLLAGLCLVRRGLRAGDLLRFRHVCVLDSQNRHLVA
jgi:hypothetical protein